MLPQRFLPLCRSLSCFDTESGLSFSSYIWYILQERGGSLLVRVSRLMEHLGVVKAGAAVKPRLKFYKPRWRQPVFGAAAC